jgi:hypothetical protein
MGEDVMRLGNAMMAAAALALVACGGSSDNNGGTPGGCSVKISGAKTATGACSLVTVAHVNADNTNGFGIVSDVTGLSVALELGTGAARTGSYTQATVPSGGIVYVPGTSSGPTWMAEHSGSDGGTFTLNLTDLGPGSTVPEGTAYLAPHGTLDATLKPTSGSGATGDVTVKVTF